MKSPLVIFVESFISPDKLSLIFCFITYLKNSLWFDKLIFLQCDRLQNSLVRKQQPKDATETERDGKWDVKQNKTKNPEMQRRAQTCDSKTMCHLKEAQKAPVTVIFLSKLFCSGPPCTELVYTESLRQESTKLPLMRRHCAQSTFLWEGQKGGRHTSSTSNLFCTGLQLTAREMDRLDRGKRPWRGFGVCEHALLQLRHLRKCTAPTLFSTAKHESSEMVTTSETMNKW